ncbi:hypothetical protein C1645_821712 [Glomus cerebriforme]|uniref:Uncharacterized protein n=1 Tax=Glomus cerebriforme TaxID=658196 RepID=A0A397T461_9GLOM|nr:hypothetical protein C1645_821712 [Glomus cerebriforme]
MEDFDKDWWPLVLNIWMQWNSHTMVNVEKEAVKNYSALAITSAIKEFALKLSLGSNASELK